MLWKFLDCSKNLCQGDFIQKDYFNFNSKIIWAYFLLCLLNFAGNLHSSGISPNFPYFCQRGVCCPMHYNHYTCWTNHIISFLFPSCGQRVKKLCYSLISLSTCQKKLHRCAFKTFFYKSKVFKGTPKVFLVSTVLPPAPPKVRWCRFLAAQKGRFRCFGQHPFPSKTFNFRL